MTNPRPRTMSNTDSDKDSSTTSRSTIVRVIPIALGISVSLWLVASSIASDRSSIVDAQSTTVQYALSDTWQSQGLTFYRPFPWPEGHVIGGIGRDPVRGVVYATDITDGVIRSWSDDGVERPVIGSPGDAPGQLDSPRDVDVLSDGRIAVSDTGNGRIQVLGADGAPLAAWAEADPQGLEVVRDRLYVISRGELKMNIYEPDGTLVRTLNYDRRLSAPEGLHFRDDVPGSEPPLARLDVADAALGRLMLLSENSSGAEPTVALPVMRAGARIPGGTPGNTYYLIGSGPSPAEPSARGSLAIIDEDERLQMRVGFDDVSDVEMVSARVAYAAVMPHGLIRIDDLGLLLNRDLYTFGRFVQPRRLAVGDRALVADAAPRVGVWSRSGVPEMDVSLLNLPVPSPGGTPVPPGPPLPVDDQVPPMDVAAAGSRAYALWESGRIRRLDAGTWDRTRDPASLDSWITAISAHGEHLAILDVVDQTVTLEDADFGVLSWFSISRGGDFAGVFDVALSADHVFLVDRHASELEVWARDDTPVIEIPVAPGALRVAAGPDGNAYVLTRNNWVMTWGPDGTLRGAWPVAAADQAPTDIDLDADGRLYVSDADDEVRVYEKQPDGGELPTLIGDEGCTLAAGKAAQPAAIELGETVEIQLVLDGACADDPAPADIVMAIDRSGSMRGSKMIAAKDASVGFVLRAATGSRLGVVGFANSATRDQALDDRRGGSIAAIGRLSPLGGTNLVAALRESRDTLMAAPLLAGAKQVIVILSDGRHTSLLDPPRDLDGMIRNVHGAGITVFTIGLGDDSDIETLTRIATSPDHFAFSPNEEALDDIFALIAGRIGATQLFQDATVTDVVPANMEFLPGTGTPIEPAWDSSTRTLTWALGAVDAPGVRLTYRLRPTEGGTHPTNVEARANFVDGRGRDGEAAFPVPRVLVRAPTPTITPTPLATNTQTVTPTPVDTVAPPPPPPPSPTVPLPTSTPGPRPTSRPIGPIYLPYASLTRCKPTARGTDIILLLDTSTSMNGTTRDGGTRKVDAAVEAALGFLRELSFPRDRVAILTFDDSPRLLQDLTDRPDQARLALLDLRLSPGTRIDAGIQAAGDVFAGPGRRPGARPVLVMMTDGQPTRSSVSQTILAAERLKRTGVTFFSIGLGPDVDQELLSFLATSPGHYFFAPDASDLRTVYSSVAETIPCE